VQWAGLFEYCGVLTEDVDDVFAAVSGHLVGIADGFGNLLTAVDSLQGEDLAQVHVRVEPALLQALVKSFGVFAQLQEALQFFVFACAFPLGQ